MLKPFYKYKLFNDSSYYASKEGLPSPRMTNLKVINGTRNVWFDHIDTDDNDYVSFCELYNTFYEEFRFYSESVLNDTGITFEGYTYFNTLDTNKNGYITEGKLNLILQGMTTVAQGGHKRFL